jgi:hypothetical protein
MSVEQAAIFLAGSILTSAGFAIITIAIIFVNNAFAKYWKPFTFGLFPSLQDNRRFLTEEEMGRIPPSFEESKKQK